MVPYAVIRALWRLGQPGQHTEPLALKRGGGDHSIIYLVTRITFVRIGESTKASRTTFKTLISTIDVQHTHFS